MEATARLRYYRGSAQKVRLVADLIRRKPLGRALATLKTTRRRCSPDLLKLVESALANAQHKDNTLDADAFVVSQIMVDGAGRRVLQTNAMLGSVSEYKKAHAKPRFMSGPQGRTWLVKRPFCHVTVVLSDDPAERKLAGLSAEPPKPVARRRTQGRVAKAVAAAGQRGAKGEEVKGKPKEAKGEAKPAKAPKAAAAKPPAEKAAKPATKKPKAPKAEGDKKTESSE